MRSARGSGLARRALGIALAAAVARAAGAAPALRLVPQVESGTSGSASPRAVPGGRYVVVGQLVVDIAERRIAHRIAPGVVAVGPQDHHVTVGQGDVVDVIDLVSGQRRCHVEAVTDAFDAVLSSDGRRCAVLASAGKPAGGGFRRRPLAVTIHDAASGRRLARALLPPIGGTLALDHRRPWGGDGAPLALVGGRGCPMCARSTPMETLELPLDPSTAAPLAPIAWRPAPATTPTPRPPFAAPAAQVAPSIVAAIAEARRAAVAGQERVLLDPTRSRMVTGGEGSCLGAWSFRDGARGRVLCPPAGGPPEAAARFLDGRRLFVAGPPAGPSCGPGPAHAVAAIWDIDTGAVERRTIDDTASCEAVSVAPVGARFLVVRPPRADLGRFDVWTWGQPRPDLEDLACESRLVWSADGARLLCGRAVDRLLALDARTGRPTAPRRRDPRYPLPLGFHTTEADLACGVRLDVRQGLVTLRAPGDRAVIATFLDLGSDWAVTLPDGTYAGSAGAARFLAWYRPDGTRAGAAETESLAQPERVRRLLAGALSCAVDPHARSQLTR